MVRITFDTDKESTQSLQKIKAFLDHAIAERSGNTYVTNTSNPYMTSETPSYATPTSTPSPAPAQPVANPFSIFDDPALSTQAPSTSAPQPTSRSSARSQLAVHGDDIFSMFNSNQPSTNPASYRGTSTNLSAQDLLRAVEDDSFEQEDKIEKKKNNDFFTLESY